MAAVARAWVVAPLFVLLVVVGLVAQPGPDPVRDEPALSAAAHRLWTDGHLVGAGAEPDQRAYLWHGPGLVALLAPLRGLEVPLPIVRLVFGPLVLGLALLLFHRLVGRRIVWTYALGLYAPFALVLGTVQKEPLAVLLVVAGLCALVARRPVTAGLALAALTMVRVEYGWVAVALLVCSLGWWAAHRSRAPARRFVVAGLVAVAGCVPWLAYTYAETGEPLYWGASSGLSLFWMSPTLPGESGQWHSPVRVQRDPRLAPYRPLFRRLDHVHPLESDRELRRRAWANVRARPGRYALNLVANASRLLFYAPMRSSRPVALVALCALFNGALLLAVLWAGRTLWRRRRTMPPEAGAAALFAGLAVVVHLPPSASPRLLMPVVPALVWLVAMAWSARSVDVPARGCQHPGALHGQRSGDADRFPHAGGRPCPHDSYSSP